MIAKARVLESRPLTPTAHGIRIERPPGFEFAPVQFVGLELDTSEGTEEYPMSMASSPTRPYIEFGARMSESSWKRAFSALSPGDEVEIDGPYGHFILDEERDAVLIAGGIGITPLKGMLEYATDRTLATKVVLLYSNRTAAEAAYAPELAVLADANPRATVVSTVTRPDESPGWSGRVGRIDDGLLAEAAAPLRDPVFYVCGKPEMVADVMDALHRLHVPRSRMRWEAFHGYA